MSGRRVRRRARLAQGLALGLGLAWAPSVACDLGSLDLDPSTDQGSRLPVAYVGRRVEVGLDGPWELCEGTLNRWSADVDLIDAALGTDADDARVHLYLYRDELELEKACKNETGCYHKRPPGPETIERLEELGPDPIYWLPFERMETQWSAALPEFLRHGTAYALTDTSCSRDVRPLDEVLALSDEQGLNLSQSRATGQWIRMLLRDFGAPAFAAFAIKLDNASSPEFVRAVFQEVYGLDLDESWQRSINQALIAPPSGWCRAPSMPQVDPGEAWRLQGALACSDGLTEGHFDGHVERRATFTVDEAVQLQVEGMLGEELDLLLDDCGCGPIDATTLNPGEVQDLEPGTYRLRIRSHTPVYTVDEGTPDLEGLGYDLQFFRE